MKFQKLAVRKRSVDHVGELLRAEFFKPSTWSFEDDVSSSTQNVEKDSEDGNGIEDFTMFIGRKEIEGERITCTWYWDEDYFLEFEFEDGSSLCNTDAKKEHGWFYRVGGESSFESGN